MNVHLELALIVVAFCPMMMATKTDSRKTTAKKKHGTLTQTIVPSVLPFENPNSTATIMDQIMKNYIKHEPPTLEKPTEVKLGIYVNSFYSVSEQTMDYSVNIYFRQSWKDPRLKYTAPNKALEKIRLGSNHYSGPKGVWIPDTFFRNEKKAQFHTITVDNKMMKLTNQGSVWYVTKISATLSCPMRLEKYPFDTQVCPMMFESFGYTMDTLYFAWLESPVDVDDSVRLAQFTLVDKLLYDCSQNYTAGAFPCQEIRFVLKRDIGYFVIQIFIPSILTVILSWVSFWINVDGVPARVSIGLLTVLTTTTQSSGINSQLPRVSYIKAIDIWMIMCLLFVFAALIEYAFVNVAAWSGVRIRTPIVRQATLQTVDGERPGVQGGHGSAESGLFRCWKAFRRSNSNPQLFTVTVDAERSKQRARRIDKVARKCFPTAFILFNVLYWMAYTIPTNVSEDLEN